MLKMHTKFTKWLLGYILLIVPASAEALQCSDSDVTVLVTDWNPGRLLKVEHDLAQVENLPLLGILKPVAIHYDPVGRRLYWTDNDLGWIGSSDLDGGNEKTLVHLGKDVIPYGMAIDSSNRKVFYTDSYNLKIGIYDLDEPEDFEMLDTEPDRPLDIVLYERKKMFFWSTYHPFPYIARTGYNGENNKYIVKSGLMMPSGITLDRENEVLFWCDQLTNRIESITIEGTDRKIIMNKELSFLDVFYFDGILYFTETKQRSILYMTPKENSHVGSIQSTIIGKPIRIHVFSDSADNKTVTILGTDWMPGQIVKVTQRLPELTELSSLVITKPVAIDYDHVRRHIYWTDVFLRQIRRCNLDGSDEKLIAQLPLNAVPDGMALDLLLSKVFYTDTGNDVIARMNLDGSNHIKIITDLDEPRAIILDERKRVFYWSDWGKKPHIAAAHYDGTHRRMLVSKGLVWPNGLTLDKKNGILYWCDAKSHKIESVTTEGTLRTTELYEPSAHYFGIFFLDDTLFFTDWNRKAILNMPANGGDVTTVGSTVIAKAVGIYVMDRGHDTTCSSTITMEEVYKTSAKKYKPQI